MKTSLNFAIIAIFLFSPIFATASILGTAELEVHWSPPIGNRYYLDYDGYLTMDGDKSWVEMFCVENVPAPHSTELYSLLSIDDSLNHYGLDAEKFIQAAWIADQYAYGSDYLKGEAQKAIWKITDVMNIVGTSGHDVAILNSLPDDLGAYDASGWALAVNPLINGSLQVNKLKFQNYLVPNPVPAPEPATMLLLGGGLLGLAGFGRKKLKQR